MQQINLLSSKLLPKNDPLAGRNFVVAWGGLAVVLVALTGWHQVSLWGLQGDMASSQSELDGLRADNAFQRANNTDPVALQSRLAQLREEQLAQTQLVELLKKQETSGFSAYLTGLAHARVDGLWLREIRITHDEMRRVSLKGTTIDALNVPALLQNLAAEEQFSGQRFEHIDLTSDADKDTVEFAILSPHQDAPG